MTARSFRNLGLVLLAGIFCRQGRCQEPVAAGVADSLTKGAGVIERLYDTEIEIESPRKARIHRKYLYTILNSTGDEYATIHTFYDKFNDLVSATGILYDAGGKVLKKIRKGEMEDWSTAGSGILMTDTRVKFYHFSCRSYPYSVSFEEETELKGLFVLPEWCPQPSSGVAVENASLVVKTPAGFPLRYKQYHYPPDAVVTDNRRTYTWKIHNRPSMQQEPLTPSWYRMETCVRLATGDFEEDGYKGQLYSWADMGRFVGSLYVGRDQLPDEAKRKVHSLVDGLTDPEQKIAVLYAFLQKDTHYVGIELGIGGWQPFDAAYVYEKKYGDCKALSNYMVALLKEAGIRAGTVLIRAGQTAPDIDTGFVCSQFNHAIVLAFAGRDSVWLECTSPLLAPGYLGSFTSDRDALLLDGAGGSIVHTPVYGYRENSVVRTVRGRIDDNGGLQASLQTDYSGLEQDDLQTQLDRLAKKELTEQRQQSLGISNCFITDLNYRTTRATVPTIEETMQLAVNNYSGLSGGRLFISPGAFLRRAAGMPEGRQPRRSELELPLSCQETDSIVLQLPQGYVPEGPLPSASYSAVFGSYRIHGELTGDTLVLICRFRQNKGIYPAGDWAKMARFFNLIHREGDRQLVFIRK
jgi:hypothetical protein